MAIQVLRTLVVCAVCAQALRGALEDEVGLLQVTQDVEKGSPEDSLEPRVAQSAAVYETLADSKRAGRQAEHMAAYEALMGKLSESKKLSHSNHILSYLREKDYSPALQNGGCLYLPTDQAWTEFYDLVEHPYPPLFAEMIANSFYPNCTTKALDGVQRTECPGGRVKGAIRCVGVRDAGKVRHGASDFRIFETDGHVGLPFKWKHHIDKIMKTNRSRRAASGGVPMDKCSESWKLPAVPENKMLVVPTQFIVCTTKPFHKDITIEMMRDQARWLTNTYRGRSTYTKMDFDHEDIPRVDMQIEFDLLKKDCTPTAHDDCLRIKFVKDKECAEEAFVNGEAAGRHNLDPFGLFTFVFVSDDQSGILGMAEFPTMTMEGGMSLIVRVSTMGLRGFSSTNTHLKLDTNYDEGDTAVHEAGHSLGLYHTFEGGCKLDGDQIADTHPEAQPTFTCTQGRSCGSTDPVHNFMDYSPDTCMSGFTETQKRRVWCVFENYRSKLFQKSLQILPSGGDHLEKTESVAASSEEHTVVPVTVPAEGTASTGAVTVNIHVHKKKPQP